MIERRHFNGDCVVDFMLLSMFRFVQLVYKIQIGIVWSKRPLGGEISHQLNGDHSGQILYTAREY